ncbi:hypothetical protein BCV69DRAFT_27654 [Microstroma glucosiphilum]|uniref:Uncharacterized protein n=1 Tax=Pseudomicrostroma glucosiphilum TaxID=1684307 RepID=A0A316U4C1_9BASI|nr:hypothetical protein BCV69DRAFT_27654 [Pseudomicrostroma glucosiphilum]PWN19658.1 hypothetical protein BCV69DRAFT_27654 [Pseudomicrostroma glucosiphilum]
MLPSCLSLATKALLLTCTLLLLSSSACLNFISSVQASPTSTLTPIPNPFPKSLPEQTNYASTSGTKPVPEVPYLYSWSSGSSSPSSPSSKEKKSPTAPPKVGRLGSPPMSERPFKYIDLTEFRHKLYQPPLPEHQRPKKNRANAPWKKAKGVLEGPSPAPASPGRKEKLKAVPARLLEGDVREEKPEMPVGKNVGKTRGGVWRKMSWCLGGCGKKA